MKNPIFLLFIFVLFSTCKKDAKVCHTPTQLSGRDHLVDISPLMNTPQIYDTITKYELQVREIVDDPYIFGFKSHVFYKGLMVLMQDYYLYQRKRDNVFEIIGEPTPGKIDFSLIPTLSPKDARQIAIQNMEYGNNCISYRLAIYDLNAGESNSTPDHKLVWQIMGDSGWPFVILDANTGQVYFKDTGIRY